MSLSSNQRLVVFGCGYVGSAVALRAQGQGLQVTALTRNSATAEMLRHRGIETIVGDLGSDDWHGQVPGSPAYILNCVSSGDPTLEGYRRSYLQGMESIAKWTRRAPAAGTLVYTSSTSVYPQGGGVAVDETAATVHDENSERAKILLAAEEALRRGSFGISRWFVLRLAGIYGPGRQHFLDQVRAGEVSGQAETHLNLIHRDDIVGAIFACFEAPAHVRNEVFNAVDDAPAGRGEIATWLANALGVPPPDFTAVPSSPRRGITPDRIILNRKLRSTLAWQPSFPTFREGYANLLSP